MWHDCESTFGLGISGYGECVGVIRRGGIHGYAGSETGLSEALGERSASGSCEDCRGGRETGGEFEARRCVRDMTRRSVGISQNGADAKKAIQVEHGYMFRGTLSVFASRYWHYTLRLMRSAEATEGGRKERKCGVGLALPVHRRQYERLRDTGASHRAVARTRTAGCLRREAGSSPRVSQWRGARFITGPAIPAGHGAKWLPHSIIQSTNQPLDPLESHSASTLDEALKRCRIQKLIQNRSFAVIQSHPWS